MTQYILVDFENVQPAALPEIHGTSYKILIFRGENQPRMSFDLAASLQPLGKQVEFIKIEGNGQNALDFHLAYFIGQLSERDKGASFIIVSKDKGFDPLLRYIQNSGTEAKRTESFADIKPESDQKVLPVIRFAEKKADTSFDEKMNVVIQQLQKLQNGKPTKTKTLTSWVKSRFQEALSNAEVTKIIGQLGKQGLIKIKDSSVTYPTPAKPVTQKLAATG